MHSTTKLRSAHSNSGGNTSITTGIQQILSCRPISCRRPLPSTSAIKSTHVIMNSTDNDHTNELQAHSILIDNASRRRGFLPYYYRTANTAEAIRRHRSHYKPIAKLPPTFLPIFHRSPTRGTMSEDLTHMTGELTERTLISHDKSTGRNHNSSPTHDKQESKLPPINDSDFLGGEIPSSIELVLQNATKKSVMERSLLETLKRQRSEHTHYRLLPINRAPYA